MGEREKEVWRQIFELYRDLPCLWKTSDQNYHNRDMRSQAMLLLFEKYKTYDKNVTLAALKKKLQNLRTFYGREKKKVMNSIQTGAGSEDVYVPQLWYYELLTFLDEKDIAARSGVETEVSGDEKTKDDPDECSEACRACLAVDCKMSPLGNGKLKQAYTDVTGISVSQQDGLPQSLCWECTGRVLSSAKYRARAKRAHDILTTLLYKRDKISMKEVRSVNRKQTQLLSTLSHAYLKNNQIIHENLREINKSNNFENTKNTNENTEQLDGDNDIDHFIVIGDGENEYDNMTSKSDMTKNDQNEIEKHDSIESEVIDDQNESSDIKDDVKIDDVESVDKVNKVTKLKKNHLKQEGKKIRTPKRTSNANVSRGEDTSSSLQECFTITNIKLEEAIASVQDRKQSQAYINAPFKCDICYRGYSSMDSSDIHALKHTEKFGDIECAVCKFRYRTKKALWCHMQSHHRLRYRCKQCDFTTNTRTTAVNHYTFHGGAVYKCPHCPKQFDKKTTYYSHLRRKHVCDFPCELCGHTFLSEQGMAMHKRRRHVLDNLKSQGPHCAACDVTFATQNAHDTHLTMSSRHNNHDNQRAIVNAYQATPRQLDAAARPRRARPRREPVTCEQCGVTLDNVYAYSHHFRKKHPAETRTQHLAQRRGAPAVCEQCGKKFHCMAMLKDHLPSHTGVRGFECGVCSKRFLAQSNLNIHMKLHEPSRPTFPCESCEKRFTSKANMKRHVLSCHRDASPRFECEACGRRVTTLAGLRAHIAHVHNHLPWPKRTRHKTIH